jgi:hypothetical protein
MSSEKEHPLHDHERTDWNLNYVLAGFTALVIAVTVILLASWWIFRDLHGSAESRILGTGPAQPVLPHEPRLQTSPSADWRLMLAEEKAALQSYRWVDRSRGIVRIPIEREMELIAQRGFPAAKPEGRNTK